MSTYPNLMRLKLEQICILALLCVACSLGVAAPPPQPPSVIYGELFKAVQLQNIFPDSKTFPDAIPKAASDEIMRAVQPRTQQERIRPQGFRHSVFHAARRAGLCIQE